METSLAGRTAIVTGAGSGIGLAISTALAAEGVRVVGGDLNPSNLKQIKGEILPVVADLTQDGAAEELVERAVAAYGTVDILVNNVGTFPYREGFLYTELADWRASIEVNFLSMVRACRAVLPVMVEHGSGSIVSIASECGRQPDVFFVDYSVTKAAILNLSKSLANEFGPHGIRSNVVSPGPTRTPPWDAPGGFGESLATEYGLPDKEAAIEHFAKEVRKLPLGRLGSPEDVANAVLFLSSDLARQVTGAEYTVNGGSYIFA